MIHPFSIFSNHKNVITQGFTDRTFGSLNSEESAFEANVEKLMKEADISRPIYMNQVHGDHIVVLDHRPKGVLKADALITRAPKLSLMIKMADCQAALLFDPISKIIGAVHSGWRGSVQNILGKTIKQMKAMGSDPADILMGISPSLGLCCAEFENPESEFPAWCQPYFSGKYVDFWQISMDQCIDEGMPEHNIELATSCTKCNPLTCFSYRNNDEGRIGAFIMLK
jgi:polyphenol oxidase